MRKVCALLASLGARAEDAARRSPSRPTGARARQPARVQHHAGVGLAWGAAGAQACAAEKRAGPQREGLLGGGHVPAAAALRELRRASGWV